MIILQYQYMMMIIIIIVTVIIIIIIYILTSKMSMYIRCIFVSLRSAKTKQ